MNFANQNVFQQSRRNFVKNSVALSFVTGMGLPMVASCKNQDKKADVIKEFKQEELAYAYDALENSIDARTMEIHFTKHHAGYVRKLNAAVDAEDIKVTSLEEMLRGVSQYSQNVRNNGGGHYNHQLFWKGMKPGGSTPSGAVLNAIKSAFGSFESFRNSFSNTAGSVFGSGWAWLVSDNEGKLAVGSTPNQDNPLMDLAQFKGIPLLGLDVWEHAYYLHYQNRRGDYIKAFWDIVDWDEVNRRYTSI